MAGHSRSGLSPRVRGSPPLSYRRQCRLRSIPTCAGQPPHSSPFSSVMPVYPHVCGAAEYVERIDMIANGLSPRVRGSRRYLTAFRQPLRSIPTCAGQPRQKQSVRNHPKVYPHVCGAATTITTIAKSRRGLSPRVRGSHEPRAPDLMPHGSIPTCAGQPIRLPLFLPLTWVYPRVCGAA